MCLTPRWVAIGLDPRGGRSFRIYAMRIHFGGSPVRCFWSSGSERFSTLCSLGRSRRQIIVSWASRPRSAAPSKISPSPPPTHARRPRPRTPFLYSNSSSPPKNRRLGTGGAQRMLAQRASLRTLKVGPQPYGGRPRRPVFVLFWQSLTGGLAMHAETRRPGGGGLGVTFAGAAERGRLAIRVNPPHNRPSEHSGENHPEFADDPQELIAPACR